MSRSLTTRSREKREGEPGSRMGRSEGRPRCDATSSRSARRPLGALRRSPLARVTRPSHRSCRRYTSAQAAGRTASRRARERRRRRCRPWRGASVHRPRRVDRVRPTKPLRGSSAKRLRRSRARAKGKDELVFRDWIVAGSQPANDDHKAAKGSYELAFASFPSFFALGARAISRTS